ncbi:DNA protecting protein DprA [Erwinia sp. OLTSP20]|uniref:DNA-protecting protein DprA n=1 Tax=unclassified Erwinia TaxID=2622719 RepID=UPI000C1A71F6|nr:MULTISPECIES: DNA-protecting protein DprA [unclassified Erwinia]PIJ49131.1 DNA protecting protein DprA [Erwinia sp. OAMSP11]PIJ67711.1 DNA protecting protein DprA [Erwinia sp. OLSSP12]PIJ79052.1 DNA protecting protein DprA [Erwinia sp. OLCASP19]PIJ80167.1 DNA protecting protein DprA [Erwinia sp. OLMTSP26]PIJ83197.1 DNA protecting protein DprA [Erwinia sp. OLMDSP33]
MLTTAIWLRLQHVTGLTPPQRLAIVKHLSQCRILQQADLQEAGLSRLQQRLFWLTEEREITETLHWLSQPDHHLITWGATDYPPLLAQIANPPAMLYVQGAVAALQAPQLAVVGSRQASVYGQQWGTLFCQALALSGLTLTSGLALGIDGIAHRSAIEVGGKTIAVLGSGLLRCYPRRHLALANDIISQGGALVSESPLHAPPLSWHFPRRNRIISGLSLGVLVVEASLRSGSLITAHHALEQNREVFALPGALGNPASEGTHALIQQGALLVAHPNNILEQLNSNLNWLPDIPENRLFSSDDATVPLPFVDVLANVGDEVTPVDVVAERAGQPVPAIVAKLLELELAGWIAAVPGGYVRLRRASHVRRTNVLI